MEAEQETQEDTQYEEEAYEGGTQQEQGIEQDIEQEEYVVMEEVTDKKQEQRSPTNLKLSNQGGDRSGFVHGLSVGLGIGCITTFVIIWISVFFTPLLPSAVTYENMLSIFIYPLIYILAVGLIALTAGIVREYYARKSSF